MSVLRRELTITIILDRNFVLRKKNQLKIFSLRENVLALSLLAYRKWSIRRRYSNKRRTFTENNLISAAFEWQ